MPAYAAADLVRELAQRLGEYVALAPQPGATPTTLIDPGLVAYLPQDISGLQQLNAWVYAPQDVPDVANRGLERRAQWWTAGTGTLTFYQAWPTAPSGGRYEFHARTPRARKLAALNSAVRQLGLYFARPVTDDSLVAVARQWQYTLPTNIPWVQVSRVEIQVNTDPTAVGYPFADAAPWNPQVYERVDASGQSSWILQFGYQPPPGRAIRVHGEAAAPDLVADSDTLLLSGAAGGRALEWVLAYAEYMLWKWEANKQPAGQADRAWQQKLQALQEERALLLDLLAPHRPARIVVPGRGDGQFPSEALDRPEWLAAYRQGS